jgi:D-glycero-D-manno-heptose 1,7-bisphosphate phosphatase
VSQREVAAFLDRDGTIIEEVGYLDRPERIELFPWTIDAIRTLNRAGIRVVMISNQSGVARGFFDEATVDTIHRRLAAMLQTGGAVIDAYYYCPHHPHGTVPAYTCACECRKPAAGLVERAVRELGVDPRRSFTVGDRWLDIGLARTVGARGVLVRTGYGRLEEARPAADVRADAVVNNLIEAVGWMLRRVTT